MSTFTYLLGVLKYECNMFFWLRLHIYRRSTLLPMSIKLFQEFEFVFICIWRRVIFNLDVQQFCGSIESCSLWARIALCTTCMWLQGRREQSIFKLEVGFYKSKFHVINTLIHSEFTIVNIFECWGYFKKSFREQWKRGNSETKGRKEWRAFKGDALQNHYLCLLHGYTL